MTMYTYCPHPMCGRKVQVYMLAEGSGVNFCCLNCWNHLYASMTEEPVEFDRHSEGCDKRWRSREHEEIVEIEGSLIIMGQQHHAQVRSGSPVSGVR